MLKPALFLDRDGVINEERDYVYKKEDIAFVDGIFELAAAARAAGYLIIVVTNQSGIGRGYYSEDDFHSLMGWMAEQFAARGSGLDAVYFSPFHPEHGVGPYKASTDCRKPAPGMILQAAREHGVDRAASILVGDSPRDIEAGFRGGVGKLFFYGDPGERKMPGSPHICRALTDIIPYL